MANSQYESWFDTAGDFSGDRQKILLEQYKLYVESSSKVSDRRGAANTFLLSANTALVTIYGLASDDGATASGTSWRWVIPVAGLLICLVWFTIIRVYRELNAAKFAVIHELEQALPARLFDLEWHHLQKRESRLKLSLSYVEQFVPAVFAITYLAFLAIFSF